LASPLLAYISLDPRGVTCRRAMGFVTNVKFRQLNGPGRHPSCQVWFLQYLLDWIIGFDGDVVVMEV